MMKISVIVPVYNAEDYIKDTIESIINQKLFNDFELIIVDDGSTDKSYEICKSYECAHNNMTCISQSNAGPSAARNNGLSLAKGEYIVFCDSDDLLEEDTLYKLWNYREESNADLYIYGLYDDSVDKNTVIKSKKWAVDEKIYTNRQVFLADFWYLLDNNLMYSQCTKMYNNEIIKKNNMKFNEEISMGEDICFNLEYFRHCNKVHVLPLSLYHYRHYSNSSSITNSYYKDYFDNIVFVNEIMITLLKEEHSYSNENEIYLNNFFIAKISAVIQNIIYSDFDKKTQKIELENIYNNALTKYYISVCNPQNKLHYLLKYLLKYKLYFLIKPMYFCLNKIRKYL